MNPIMTDNLATEPMILTRDEVRLAHYEAGPKAPDGPPLLFIHGWTGDHGIFTPQICRLAGRHRVVAIDLRGHGASDAPRQEYTLPGFADDIAWQCGQLGLQKPVIIGHSLGGAIALELCVRSPDLALGLLMIDSPIMVPPAMRKSREVRQWLDCIGGPDYPAVSQGGSWNAGCDFDDPARRKAIYDAYVRPPCEKTPQHVAFSTMRNFILNYDQEAAANACKVPMAYISTDVPAMSAGRFLDRLQELCPHLVTAKTLLSGHFNTIEVTDQVNAMIERFLAVGLRRTLSRT